MKTISAGWRPKSGDGGRWDEDYISRLETEVWGWGMDEDYISRPGDRSLGAGGR